MGNRDGGSNISGSTSSFTHRKKSPPYLTSTDATSNFQEQIKTAPTPGATMGRGHLVFLPPPPAIQPGPSTQGYRCTWLEYFIMLYLGCLLTALAGNKDAVYIGLDP